jgi:hypothetical protein
LRTLLGRCLDGIRRGLALATYVYTIYSLSADYG